MISRLKRPLALLAVNLVFIGMGSRWAELTALACCPPPTWNDAYEQESCGTRVYNFSYRFQGENTNDGPYSAYGACAGNYTKCDCTYVDPYDQYGIMDFVVIPPDASGHYIIYWNTTNYTPPTCNQCTSRACVGSGAIEVENSYFVDYLDYTDLNPCCFDTCD